MSVETYPTANSDTRIAYDTQWLVLDIGSGHSPHPRADILVDRFLTNDIERAGHRAVIPTNKPFILADACALPFKDKAFDFVICSHVAEHIDAPDLPDFCRELNRVARRGFIETPSRFAETLRHAPNHRWYISSAPDNRMLFRATSPGHPLGRFGKLFWSIYFYKTIHVEGDHDVFQFAHGLPSPWHDMMKLNRAFLRFVWKLGKSFTYTRLLWEHSFSCHIIE